MLLIWLLMGFLLGLFIASASGYSTAEIAEALGVSTSTVSKYLSGKE